MADTETKPKSEVPEEQEPVPSIQDEPPSDTTVTNVCKKADSEAKPPPETSEYEKQPVPSIQEESLTSTNTNELADTETKRQSEAKEEETEPALSNQEKHIPSTSTNISEMADTDIVRQTEALEEEQESVISNQEKPLSSSDISNVCEIGDTEAKPESEALEKEQDPVPRNQEELVPTDQNNTNSTNITTDQVESHSSTPIPYNPAISDDIREDVEKIKGDAIGNTLYSSRFVLKTLIRLATENDIKPLEEDEDFEKDLCTLWDMTIEKDVVMMLLEHKVPDLFANLTQSTNDRRLTEILVGIIGNMCAVKETRDILCNSETIMPSLLSLVFCTDALVLVQLMRLIHATLVFENNGDECAWLVHFVNIYNFVPQFAYILSNSINRSLLINAFEALNAMCSKFSVIELDYGRSLTFMFRNKFVKSDLIIGLVDAFQQLCPDQGAAVAEDEAETSAPSKTSMRIINQFLDIIVALAQYEEVSQAQFEEDRTELFECIVQILRPLCSTVYLFPVGVNEQAIIENVNELFQSLGDIFSGAIFEHMINIWALLDGSKVNGAKPNDAFEDDAAASTHEDDEICVDDLSMTILEFITRTCHQASLYEVKLAITNIDVDRVKRLYNTLCAGNAEPDIDECCEKLQECALLIWNLTLSNHITDHS